MATDYTVAYVSRIPNCDVHTDVLAEYDAKIPGGPWGNLCGQCYTVSGASLGLGKGQRYILGEPPVGSREEKLAEVNAAIASGDIDAFFDACGDGDPMDFLDY